CGWNGARCAVCVARMASLVQKKAPKQWMWMAMDATSRQVIAVYGGERSRRSAKRLWAKIPEAEGQHATFYTDQYVVYAWMLPAAQHRAISKLVRKTKHIERCNTTRRGPAVPRASPRRVVVFQEARQAYRCHRAVYWPLQPGEHCGLERALQGVH